MVSGMSAALSPPFRAEAEAAAWIARLNSGARREDLDAPLRAWLAEGEGNREAFERALEAWEIIPGAALMAGAPNSGELPPDEAEIPPGRQTPGRLRALAIAVASLILVVATAFLVGRIGGPDTLSVPVGEQRVATLDDGTRVSLNTGSDLVVDYREDLREVRLEAGEALFEVERDTDRPFMVIAGDERIVALGTSFVVRKLDDSVSVTLIEGSVAISRADRPGPSVVLDPGQRWSASANASPRIDAPPLAGVTAWREGKAVFDDTSLAEAAAEMNRYGGPEIRLSDPRLAALRVSGAFDTREPVAFAEAIAALHGLHAVRDGAGVELRRE